MTEETFSLGGHAVPNDLARQVIDFYKQFQAEHAGKASFPPFEDTVEPVSAIYRLLQRNGFGKTEASEILRAVIELIGEADTDRLQ